MTAAGAIAAWLAKPAAKWILGAAAIAAVAIAVAAVLRGEFNKGEAAGKAAVTQEVQRQTIRTIEGARESKEKADEAVRSDPVDSVIDSLR